MNAAHIHLLLNHFPLVGFVFSFLILALGLYLSDESYIRAGLLVILIAGFLAVPTYLTGEPAEEVIEKLPAFSEKIVETHEEAAELAILFISLTTLAAGGALWMSIKRKVASKVVLKFVLALNFVSLVLIGQTNNLGGKISHTEIRSEVSQLPTNSKESED